MGLRRGPGAGLLVVAASLVALMAAPERGTAQAAPETAADPATEAAGDDLDPRSERAWWNVWTERSPYDRVAVGALTLHPLDADFPEFERNQTLGGVYDGYFALTFINSLGRRTWAAGVERSWVHGGWRFFEALIGYRLGLMHGYGEELYELAARTPVFPGAGILGIVRLGPLVTEVTYMYRAISFVGGIHF